MSSFDNKDLYAEIERRMEYLDTQAHAAWGSLNWCLQWLAGKYPNCSEEDARRRIRQDLQNLMDREAAFKKGK